jgi:hypothetical protein
MSPTNHDAALVQRCRDLSDGALAAAAWVERNRELVRAETDNLTTALRRSARRLKKFEVAVQRKMCVGVFGPSQSGKSYLISAMARGADGKLIADFGSARTADGRKIDFVADINPQGGKESTGLVTRFTLTAPPRLPDNCPVQLRLLSEMDVVRILGNTFFADFEHTELPKSEEISAAVEAVAKRAGGAVRGAPSEDDVAELQEYFTRNFRAEARVQVLDKVFWPTAIALAPKLDAAGRVQLFSIIWNSVEPLANLYRRLQTAIEALGHADQAFSPLDALIPRETSIIDVATLKGLGGKAAPKPLLVVTDAGIRANLDRCDVTALTAEITVVMANKPDDFFDHTDLLDFPGYRSRLRITDITAELSKDEALEIAFLRGKVAYLFERYCAESELTSMLLCIGPGNQEVQTLPKVIGDWLKNTHGETPERRNGRPVSLFFVLTKFDQECEFKAGAATAEADISRWSNRLQSSLTNFFGLNHDWPTQWDLNGPFNNLFWIRNPNVRAPALFDYVGGTETVKAHDDYIDKLRTGFLANPDVKNHFRDPAQAWQAAMSPCDGGITYLREQLRPLCNPDLKLSQIRDSVADEAKRLVDRLRVYHRSDDKAAERKAKDELARKLAGMLAQCAQAQRFGQFLRALLVADHELFDLFFQIERTGSADGSEADAGAAPQQVIGQSVSADDLLDDIFGGPPVEEAAPVSAATSPKAEQQLDMAAQRALAVEKYWISQLRGSADDIAMQRHFNIPQQEFSSLVHELTVGASRMGLVKLIEDGIRDASRFTNIKRDKLIWKQASRASVILNTYIDWLGLDPRSVPADQRKVTINGRDINVFKAVAAIALYPVLGENQAAHDAQYYRDWIASFVNLVSRNVDFDGASTIDPEQNSRLGSLLDGWRTCVNG